MSQRFRTPVEAIWYIAGSQADVTDIGDLLPAAVEIIQLTRYRAQLQKLSATLAATGSVFSKATSSGITKLVECFMRDVAQLETDCIKGEIHTELQIAHALHKYLSLLPPIIHCIEDILSKNLKGCLQVQLMHERMCSIGDPDARTFWISIIRTAITPLIVFTSQWLSYGEFRDPQEEFFIRSRGFHRGDDVSAAAVYVCGSLVDAQTANSTSVHSKDSPKLAISTEHFQSEEEFLRGAEVVEDLLPTAIISPSTARQILMAGVAVRLLRKHAKDGVEEWEHVLRSQAEPAAAVASGEARDDDDSPFTFLHAIQIAGTINSLKDLPYVTMEAVDFVVSKVMSLVMHHVWRLMVKDGDLLKHLQGFRDYFLLARGDLYRAFYEKLRPLRRPGVRATQATLSQISSGPWHLAAQIANIKTEFSAGSSETFDRCYWYFMQKAMHWYSPEPLSVSGAEESASVSDRLSTRTSTKHSKLSAWTGRNAVASWKGVTTDKILQPRSTKHPRSDGVLVSVGSASVCEIHAQSNPGTSGASHVPRGLETEAVWAVETLFLATQQSSAAGAVHCANPFFVRHGIDVRTTAHVHFPAFHSSKDRSNHETASFGLVLHRSTLLAVDDAAHGVRLGAGAVPPAGNENFPSALSVHFLCRQSTSSSQSSSLSTFRIVVAVYANKASPDKVERTLLASGVIPSVMLPASYYYMSPKDGSLMSAYPISFILSYEAGTTVDTGESRIGRCRIAILSKLQPETDSGNVSGLNISSSAAYDEVVSHTVIDAPMQLDTHLEFGSWGGPGVDRAYVALTAHAGWSMADKSAPQVSLDFLDVFSHGETEEPLGCLTLGYSVPWPLHAVLTTANVSLHQDLFRMLFRTKGVSLSLQDTWRTLMDSFSLPNSTGAGIVTEEANTTFANATFANTTMTSIRGRRFSDVSFASTASAVSAVPSQVSGVGGKRSKDPTFYARQRQRIAVHKLLQPVWLLRSQMSATVDSLLYHMHADVMEAAFAAFLNEIKESKDFATLMRANDKYLQTLKNGCFLSHPSLLACVQRLLSTCERFVRLVATNVDNLAALLQPSGARDAFTAISAAFQSDVRMLLSYLQSSMTIADSAALLTRMDFNGFLMSDKP